MEEKIEFYKEKEFKDTEIGRIPKDWEIKNLQEIMHIFDSKRVPIEENKRALMKGPFPYCGANGIIDYINDFIFDGEYILLAEDGGYWGKFEKSSYIMSGKFWVNNHAHILKISDKTHGCNYFYMYYFNYVDLSKYISGTTRGKLTQGTLRLIKLPFPPFEEQKKIAEILSNIDGAIQKTDEIIDKTESLKKGLMQELFTKGIGHKEFKDTEIGRIPKDWEAIRFGDIVNLVKGRRPREFANERVRDSLPYLSAENLRNNNIVQFVKVSGDIILVDEGDLILIWDGSNAGEFFLGKRGVLSSTMVKIFLKEKLYHGRFLFYLLKTKENYLKDQTKGTGIPHVDGTILRSLVIPLPTLVEQQKIAEILSTIDKKLEVLKQEKVKFEKIKQWFMDKLLTGRIRVRVA